jgi:hypothetical protein
LFPPRAVIHPAGVPGATSVPSAFGCRILNEKRIKLKLFGNAVYYTNPSILLVKNMLFSRLHHQIFFIVFPFRIRCIFLVPARAVIHPAGVPGATSVPSALGSFSTEVSIKSFCTSQFQHKSVNLSFTKVTIKDKLTDLCGNRLLQNDSINTFCETRLMALLLVPGARGDSPGRRARGGVRAVCVAAVDFRA